MSNNKKREWFQKPIVEDRYIEIRTNYKTSEVSIIHNFTNEENMIKSLENALNHLRNKI